ncbi:MAG TPA: hypothetical protein VEW46_20095 [Pyrinomonadaceae bacterium]|nr:hypothetical protein [Pyrinomonadaceae bacterium]
MFDSLIGQLTSFVRQLASHSVHSNQTRKAGPALLRLHIGLSDIARKSTHFLDLAEALGNRTSSDISALIRIHEELASCLLEFLQDIQACERQLSVFDSNLHWAISEIVDMKGERLRMWRKIFEQAKLKLRDDNVLSRIADNEFLSRSYYGRREEIPLVSVSLDDSAGVAAMILQGRSFVVEIVVVQEELAEFIKQHCKFVDLFDS